MKKIIFYTECDWYNLSIISDYKTTEHEIRFSDKVKTYSIAHLSFDLIDQGFEIYLRGKNKKEIKLYPGMIIDDKIIDKNNNLLKIFKSGMFNKLINE